MPTEIRLHIYSYLLDDNENKTFQIRTADPKVFEDQIQSKPFQRTSYRILGGILYRQSQLTTYFLASSATIHTNLLSINRSIYEEVSTIIYGSHSFDFGDNVEAIVPFLSDLRPSTRSLVKSLSITKKVSIFTRDFDRCEWHNACAFISQNLHLQKICLRVLGGKPHDGWDDLIEYTVRDFKTLASVGFEGVEWIREFQQIRALKELEIVPVIEHCPPPKTVAMEFFAAFSASIDKGFTEYLKDEMLKGC